MTPRSLFASRAAFGMESAYRRLVTGPVADQAQPFEQCEAVVHGTF